MLGHKPDPWSSSSVGARLTCAVLAKGDAPHLCLRATPTWSAERQRAEVRGQQERASLRESHMGHIYQTPSEGNMHFQMISLLRST